MQLLRIFLCLLCFGFFTLTAAPKKSKKSSNMQKTEKVEKSVEKREPQDQPVKKEIDPLQVPYLSTYYIQPVLGEEDRLTVRFYVTDWFQSEYRLLDPSHRFTVTVTCGPFDAPETQKIVKKDLPAGDHEITLEKMSAGEHCIAVSAVDSFGRQAPVVYHEVWVRTKEEAVITDAQTHKMTADDLKKYKICNTGDYGEFHFIPTDHKRPRADQSADIAVAAASVKPSAGKYAVVACAERYEPSMFMVNERSPKRGALNAPKPEWLPLAYGCKTCKVIYAPDYDKVKVENEAKTTANGLNQLMADLAAAGKRKLVLLPGTYRVSNEVTLMIPTRFTLDMNGATVKMNECTGCQGMIMQMEHAYDSHVVNGIVEGDYFEHDYANSEKNSEWVCGVGMHGDCRYCSYERMLVRYVTGYGVTHGFYQQFATYHPLAFGPGSIDPETGREDGRISGLVVSDTFNVSEFLTNAGYLTVSHYQGYQGISPGTGAWNLQYHFYDKDDRYLGAVSGSQYRRMRIPMNAEYGRVSAYRKDENTYPTDLTVNLFKVPWNSWYKDLFITNARCVGMAPSAMFNFKIENCTIAQSGETSATCAFDAEDGWDMAQDVLILRNQFIRNPCNELLTCSGHNFQIEDNECTLYFWSRTNSYVVRNNDLVSATYGAGLWRNRTLMPRIENNTYKKFITIGDDPEKPKETADGPNAAQMKLEKKDVPAKQPDWFICAKDVSAAPTVTCRASGMLVGEKLTGLKTRGVSLFKCELSDSEVEMGTSKFISSKVRNITGHTNGPFRATDSTLEKIHSSCYRTDEIIIRNCTLKDVSYHYAYWTKPARITFIGCRISNPDCPVIETPAYSIDQFKFIDCEIDTGSAPVVKIYDMRAQETDSQEGTVLFKNCRIAGSGDFVITHASGSNEKPLNFRSENSEYSGTLVESPAFSWVVESDSAGAKKQSAKSFSKKKDKSKKKKR